jgi:hypothetical protein
MATAAERMRALWERARRGLRRLAIDVSERDLQAIAERGKHRRRSAGAGRRPVSQRRARANLTA